MTTFAPSSAKRSAVARPMPLPAPVMMATFPWRRGPRISITSVHCPYFGDEGFRREMLLGYRRKPKTGLLDRIVIDLLKGDEIAIIVSLVGVVADSIVAAKKR